MVSGRYHGADPRVNIGLAVLSITRHDAVPRRFALCDGKLAAGPLSTRVGRQPCVDMYSPARDTVCYTAQGLSHNMHLSSIEMEQLAISFDSRRAATGKAQLVPTAELLIHASTKQIRRAPNPMTSSIQNKRIDHRRPHILVPEQPLHRTGATQPFGAAQQTPSTATR